MSTQIPLQLKQDKPCSQLDHLTVLQPVLQGHQTTSRSVKGCSKRNINYKRFTSYLKLFYSIFFRKLLIFGILDLFNLNTNTLTREYSITNWAIFLTCCSFHCCCWTRSALNASTTCAFVFLFFLPIKDQRSFKRLGPLDRSDWWTAQMRFTYFLLVSHWSLSVLILDCMSRLF